MSQWTRRHFVGMSALAGGALAVRQDPSVPGALPRFDVNFVGDGLELSPAAYAELLARLAKGGVKADEYSRGGEVEALEKQFAGLLGKESAVFLPSGTLANHLAVRSLAGSRRRVLVQDVSHLYNDSGDCAQQLSGLTLVPLAPGRATFTWEEALAAIDRGASGRVPAAVGAISIESPVRRLHGEAFSFDAMREISAEARRRGIGLHLDGARLFVQCAYVERSPAEYGALFDTVYVSLWKCFNSGGGAILAGPRALLSDLYQVRRMFGGALWNAWPYAAVARRYADGYLERLAGAVTVARQLIAGFGKVPEKFSVERVHDETSLFRLIPHTRDLPTFRQKLSTRGINLPEPDGSGFWLKVNESLRGIDADSLLVEFVSAVR